MRILDNSDQSLENVILYLTAIEAAELKHGLDDLISKSFGNHVHVSSDDYKKELTICIYDIKNLKGFSQRSIDLINNE